MASGSWNFSTNNQYITGRIRWSSTSNGSKANTSTVTAYLDYMKSSSSTAATYGTFNGAISINGSSGAVSKYITLSANNSWVNVGSRAVTVGHNNDGSKSTTIAASGGISGTSFSSSSTSKSVALDKIPRYANITTWKNTAVTQTSATFQWGADASCSAVYYMIGNGSWAATSGSTFTINNLAPNTSYSVKLKVRRSDSGLETTSGAITVKTKPIASISNSSLSFDIGGDLELTLANYALNASTFKFNVERDDGTWTTSLLEASSDQNIPGITLPLSGITDTLYSCCTTKNEMNFKISCGTTINGTFYENISYGTARVTDSDPVFTDYSHGNTDTATSSVLQNAAYLIQNYGNMQAQISAANRAVPKNHAAVTEYIVEVTDSKDEVKKQLNAEYSDSEVLINLGTLSEPGDYNIKIYARDSRGNISGTVTKTFHVLPYSRPASKVTLARINEFEKEITIDFSSVYSRLKIGTASKNNAFTVKYRYAEVGTSYESTYTTITGITSADIPGSPNELKATYLKDSGDDPFITLDIEKSYNFEFVISDRITTTTETTMVDKGIPIFMPCDNGKVTVGMLPDFDSSADFQVGTDIMATDSDGTQRLILDEIDKTNANLSLTNKGLSTIYDYVIETYSENEWYVKKWHSGFAECFGLIIASTTNYSGPFLSFFYGYYIDLNLPTGLFYSAPKKVFSVGVGTGFAMPAQAQMATSTSKVRFYALATLSGKQAITISAHLWGTWK